MIPKECKRLAKVYFPIAVISRYAKDGFPDALQAAKAAKEAAE